MMGARENDVTDLQGILRRWLVALATILAVGGAQAEEYQVEVIVFRHAATQAAGAWPTPDSLPDFATARRLADAATEAEGAPTSGAEPAPFTQLPATAFRLAGAEKLLAGSPAYEVIAHEAWQQPDDAGVAVYVGDSAQARASDSATAVDDTAVEPAAAAARPRAEGSLRLQVAQQDMRVQSDFVVMAGDTPVRVRATRNLKSGELHYLDHEVLGVLLQITALSPTSEATPADGTAPNADVPAEEFSD